MLRSNHRSWEEWEAQAALSDPDVKKRRQKRLQELAEGRRGFRKKKGSETAAIVDMMEEAEAAILDPAKREENLRARKAAIADILWKGGEGLDLDEGSLSDAQTRLWVLLYNEDADGHELVITNEFLLDWSPATRAWSPRMEDGFKVPNPYLGQRFGDAMANWIEDGARLSAEWFTEGAENAQSDSAPTPAGSTQTGSVGPETNATPSSATPAS